ncbi:MAG: sugar phosphate nucleotidyltransferase [Anaerolineae bacterium]|nr:sugar phosphate nucleotidyltransferase [Anaerolineae bacterium]
MKTSPTKPLTLLILAAGMGSRYGGLKQIDPVGPNGESIIDYSVYDAIRAGFTKLVFVIRRDIEADFKRFIGNKFADRIAVEYAFQELEMVPEGFDIPPHRKKPWGTGHAVLVADQVIDENFAVINADDFYGAVSFRTLADNLTIAEDNQVGDYMMVGFILRNTLSEFGSVSRGLCQLDNAGFLQDVVELTTIEKDGDQAKYVDETGHPRSLTGDEIVSLNMWGFTPSIFDHLHRQFRAFIQEKGGQEKAEFFIPTVVNSLIDQKLARVKVLSTTDPWFGVTYREDKARVVEKVQRLIDQNVYPSKLW